MGEASGALYHFHEPPLRVGYQPGIEALSVFDADVSVAWYWVGSAGNLPSRSVEAPLLSAFPVQAYNPPPHLV